MPNILVVDDRHEALFAVQEILARPEWNIVAARSGSQALKRVLERDFAVILLDVMMPDIDGFEVARIIKQRERSRHTPIIFLTAAGADVTSIYKGYSVGAVDYMVKPLDGDVLRAKVEIFVELFAKDQRIKEQGDALRAADRREREHELAQLRLSNERRYRNLAEAIPQIVWTASPDGSVTYFNERWFQFSGQTSEQALRSGWMAALHPSDAEAYARQWSSALAEGRVHEVECRLRGQDGNYRWHLCRAIPERAESDAVVAWLGTYTDVDDRIRACESAEQAVVARDEFLSIASHELRTPLMTLQLRLQSIQESLDAPLDERSAPEASRWLASAARQAGRLGSLVDSLLDVSRITSGRLTLNRERFDLADATREVAERFAEAAETAGCPLSVEACAAVVGTWDRLRIEQILLNLIGNALKYAPRAPVEISVEANEAKAKLTVRDHGTGLLPADFARIFSRFERAVPARKYGGLGLGLYIAREIAVAHGGGIGVASTPGQGATFLVELPLESTTGQMVASLSG